MRPRGEVRQALQQAAGEIASGGAAATWRDLAEHARVGYDAARGTVRDMVRAGELVPCGHEMRAHSRRAMVLYAYLPEEEARPVEERAPDCAAAAGELQAVVNSWAAFR